MEIRVRKTTELTLAEKNGIVSLFSAIFEKDRSLEQFHNQFLNNPLGYSFHAMMVDGEKIVGSDSYIPSYYIVNGERILFANSVDTMVDKPYRDFFALHDMIAAVRNYMRLEGIVFVYGFPNAHSYPVYIKSKLMQDIGSLIAYCLPYRIGGVKPALKTLDCFSIFFVRAYIFLTSLFAGKKTCRFAVEKEPETYNATRYRRFDGKYIRTRYKGSEFVYKLMGYEGIRSVFLIDVFEKSAVNFNRAVQYIVKNHHQEFDILLYVGVLPFRWHGLLRVPEKLAPKKFYFIGEILQKEQIDRSLIFTLDNWDVNLSNYDLL
jgi:hypothetical protein